MEKHVLVVDDDGDIREALTTLLVHEGYAVASAANGQEALNYLRSAGDHHVVLLDLTMPVCTGWEVLEEYQQDTTLHLHSFVVVSALVKNYTQRLRSTNAVACLAKPVELRDLLQVVEQFS